ncbi:hypothetical protein HMPREF3187_01312 [Aerococcus christensenii]|uniref:Uncharacterized protein n=1 Tax=Aerococcus christensenii TaxID=87541 RepID=A0A133XUC7_9LACT|nr:hypothetical protein HMPREF3187_01312 [Aerococcus christensenii]
MNGKNVLSQVGCKNGYAIFQLLLKLWLNPLLLQRLLIKVEI